MNLTNAFVSDNISCEVATGNPWCNQSEISKAVEVTYLMIVATVGTFGNLLVIFSIAFRGRIHKNGNMFIVNLAVADLMMTGVFVPLIVPNVLYGDLILPTFVCSLSGFLAILSGACSLSSLTAIAADRYWAVVRSSSYQTVFSKRRTNLMIVLTWLWSVVYTIPPLVNAGGKVSFSYDKSAMACVWSMHTSIPYDACLMTFCVALPLILIFFFYWRIFSTVRYQSRRIRNYRKQSTVSLNGKIKRNSLKREINLFKTLAVTVLVFVLCWTPYLIAVLLGSGKIPPMLHKAFGWLTSTNSSLNFIIYGVMNKNFRHGYKVILGQCLHRSVNQRVESSRSSV